MRLAPWNRFKPSSKIFLLSVPRWYFYGSFFVSCVSHALAPVHCCLVVTCWERAALLALVSIVYCIFYYFPMWYSWVRCGTWLYHFLIFAVFLTLYFLLFFKVHDMEFAPNLDIIINETLPALQKVKDSGKAKFIGITGYPLENFR